MANAIISGATLSALIDEANSASANVSVQHGVLFGDRRFRRTEVLSDTHEDDVVDEMSIAITSFLNFRRIHPFWSNHEFQLPVEIATHRDIVGIVVVRRDGIKYPSARDVIVAKEFHKAYIAELGNQEVGHFPFLIFLVNVPADQYGGWVFAMDFLCFGTRGGDNDSIFTVDVKIPSLAADSAADYKAAASLNSSSSLQEYPLSSSSGAQQQQKRRPLNSTSSSSSLSASSSSSSSSSAGAAAVVVASSSSLGSSGSPMTSIFRAAVATSIQQTVDAELLADKLVSEIQGTVSQVTDLEREVAELRQRLAARLNAANAANASSTS